MNIIEQLIPVSATGRRPQLPMTPMYITIHGTANPKSTAKNEANNVCNNKPMEETSFHIVVDDKSAYQVLPFNEVAWHAGDGEKGTGNRQSIAIEICESGNRKQTLLNTIEIVANLMKQFNIPITNIVQHNHWSGKDCPRILRNKLYVKDNLTWEWFIEQLQGVTQIDYKRLYEESQKTIQEILVHVNEISKLCDIINNNTKR